MEQLPCLTPELALLVACSLGHDGQLADAVAKLESGPFDWPRFAMLACANDVAAIAIARLDVIASGLVPDTEAEMLRGHLQASAVLELAHTALVSRISSLFGESQISVLVLKGMALSHQLHAPNPHWRSASDIDLLIDPAALDHADAALRKAGFVRRWPPSIASGPGREMQLLLANVFDYAAPVNRQLIELHHRIALNPHWVPESFAALHSRSVEIVTGQGAFRGLGETDLVRYLCWHAFAHDGFRLKWVSDISRALRHAGAESCLAVLQGAADPGRVPLELADRLLGIFDPQLSRSKGPTTFRQSKEIKRIVAGIEHPNPLPEYRNLTGLAAELRYRLFLVRLAPGFAGKAYELFRTVCDPRDVQSLGLGRRWMPLYFVLGPLLALGRFSGRNIRSLRRRLIEPSPNRELTEANRMPLDGR